MPITNNISFISSYIGPNRMTKHNDRLRCVSTGQLFASSSVLSTLEARTRYFEYFFVEFLCKVPIRNKLRSVSPKRPGFNFKESILQTIIVWDSFTIQIHLCWKVLTKARIIICWSSFTWDVICHRKLSRLITFKAIFVDKLQKSWVSLKVLEAVPIRPLTQMNRLCCYWW